MRGRGGRRIAFALRDIFLLGCCCTRLLKQPGALERHQPTTGEEVGPQETGEGSDVKGSASENASWEHVEAMAPRRLLLVGEGNFSFAAALSETLDPSTSITATCLQRPADLARDPLARENLQRLRERGSEAHPSVKPRPAVAPPKVESVGTWGFKESGGCSWSLRGHLQRACCVPRPGLFCMVQVREGFSLVPGLKTSFCLYFVPGTEVRFGVDCTQLVDAFELQDREFDRIYFNFPHCGRKAGVAKNRELLAKFFQR